MISIVAAALGVSAAVSSAQQVEPVRADSVRPYLVFAPAGETWFVAVNRGKRMLLDIGRVDLEVRKDSAVAAAYREAVALASPWRVGDSFTLRAPWGAEEVRARAYDSWNGRIVLVLEGSTLMDSVAQGRSSVAASGYRPVAKSGPDAPPSPSAPPPPLAATANGRAPCARLPIEGSSAERVNFVRDSLEQSLRALGPPIYERLVKRVTATSSRVSGCFGARGRVLLAVSLRANGAEWARERVVMLDLAGRATSVTVDDLRFRVHDLLHVVDVDGDGVDDVAAVGRAFRAGGTTLLRYDERRQRLVRLAAGFVWEDL